MREEPDLLRRGLGRAEIPQFENPRITPLSLRMRLPALRAILGGSISRLVMIVQDGGVLFDFSYAVRPNLMICELKLR